MVSFIGSFHINEFSIIGGGGRKKLLIHNRIRPGVRIRVGKKRETVQEKLVVGCWEVIPLESGVDNSVEEYTTTYNKENGGQGEE